MMELKSINPNGVIVPKSMLNHAQLIFLEELLKLSSKTNPIHYFLKDLLRLLAK